MVSKSASVDIANGQGFESENLQNDVPTTGEVKGKCVDNFVDLSWYTLFICITAELNILCQLCTMMFMVYAGRLLRFMLRCLKC